MTIQEKIQEAENKGFVKGNTYYGTHYPKMACLQTGPVEYDKQRNALVARGMAKGMGNVSLVSTIYEFNGDKWASNSAPEPVVVKVKEIVNVLQIKKGDFVKFKVETEEFAGTITKYPSNTAIVIEVNGVEHVVNKLQILYVISKAK